MSSPPPVDPNAAAADHDALPAGTRFGELEIRRVLGIGGFGIVYLAVDHALEREVALKEYMPSSLASRGQGPQITVRSGSFAETYAVGLRSFVNEARLLAKFDHPSMVKVYRFWEANGTAYMVMPFLQGRTLRDVRRSMSQPPDEAWIRSVLDPVLAAVELLHKEGVYHRDIAPDNILLPPEAAPILLDFGAARRVISDRTQSLTAILKPSYAPIEQYAEMVSLRQGPWTDIYAIGAVIHFLLFGAPPPPATARAVQDDLQGLATRQLPGASPRLMATLAWALAVRPAERPQNIEALRGALDGRIAPPAATREGVTLPGATALMPVSSAYEPTLRVEGGYSQPTEAQHTVQAMRVDGTRAQPADMQRRTPAEETIVQPLTPRTPRPPPPPAPAPVPVATSSRGGVAALSIGVVALLVGGAGWWMFGGSRPTPAAAVAGSPAVVAAPALPPAAPAPAPAPATAVPPAPEQTAATRPAAEPAARPKPEPAPAPGATARPNAAVEPAPRLGNAAESGALLPRTPPRLPARTDPPAEPARAAVAEPVPAPAQQAATRPAPSPVAAPPATATTPPAPATAAAGPATAREACGGRVLIALAYCMERECNKPQYRANPECVKIADARRRRELQ